MPGAFSRRLLGVMRVSTSASRGYSRCDRNSPSASTTTHSRSPMPSTSSPVAASVALDSAMPRQPLTG